MQKKYNMNNPSTVLIEMLDSAKERSNSRATIRPLFETSERATYWVKEFREDSADMIKHINTPRDAIHWAKEIGNTDTMKKKVFEEYTGSDKCGYIMLWAKEIGDLSECRTYIANTKDEAIINEWNSLFPDDIILEHQTEYGKEYSEWLKRMF